MARIHNVLILVALCAISVTLAQVSQGGPHSDQGGPPSSQGGPHQSQGRVRRQAEDDGTFDISEVSKANWTTCEFSVVNKLTCYDCQTRLICKQVGGLLKVCQNPFRPYCNNGLCSPVPSAGCA